jgi:hypothetical protein
MRTVVPRTAVLLALLPVVACSNNNPVGPEATAASLKPTIDSREPLKAASTASASAPVILSVPDESPGSPIYAGIAGFFMNTDGEWVAIEIVRERGCIPADFNLLQFSNNPAAFECRSLIGGKEWWYPEDLEALANRPWSRIPPFPFQARLVGLPGMLIYFVRLSELNAAITDGVLTIGELESLRSLLVGHVNSYLQVQHNSNLGHAPGHSNTTAHGTLDDGRSFFYRRADRDNESLNTQIRFK